ncbi:MAG: YIP1 family protein, partial [Thermoprotei archaeon]
FVDQMKEGFSIMLHPTKANYENRSIGGALGFYYKFSLIPLVLYIIFSLFSANPIFALVGIFSIWIAAPIGFFITALLYHAFGKLFKAFKNPYQNTFSAMIYGVIPLIMFIWLQPIPVIGMITIIFGIWTFIVMIFALARLQNVGALTAFGVIVVTVIVLVVIMVVIFFTALAGLFALGTFSGSSTIGTSCIATSGYLCQNPVLSASNNRLTFTFGQATGAPIYNAVLYVAPISSGINAYGFPTQVSSYSIGTLKNGQTITATFYPISSLLSSPLSKGALFYGYVWLNYSTAPSGPTTSAKVASLIVHAS